MTDTTRRHFLKFASGAVAGGIIHAGCSSDSRPAIAQDTPSPTPTPTQTPLPQGVIFPPALPWVRISSPKGTEVWVNQGLMQDQARLNAILAEIDSTETKTLHGLHFGPGAPLGWKVVVMGVSFWTTVEPGKGYEVYGQTDYASQTIWIGSRARERKNDNLLLPALGHEYGHAYSGEPCWDHNPDNCPWGGQ